MYSQPRPITITFARKYCICRIMVFTCKQSAQNIITFLVTYFIVCIKNACSKFQTQPPTNQQLQFFISSFQLLFLFFNCQILLIHFFFSLLLWWASVPELNLGQTLTCRYLFFVQQWMTYFPTMLFSSPPTDVPLKSSNFQPGLYFLKHSA